MYSEDMEYLNQKSKIKRWEKYCKNTEKINRFVKESKDYLRSRGYSFKEDSL